jgi:hypothetical protein
MFAALPVHFPVNLYTTLWVNMCTMHLWVDDRLISSAQVQPTLPAPFMLNLYTILQWVIDACCQVYDEVIQAPIVLPAQFWVNKFAAHFQVNGVTTYSWVNEFVPFCWLNESVLLAHDLECAEYCASVDQVNERMACIQISIAVHMSVNTCVVQVNETAVTLTVLECGDYFNGIQLKDDTIQRFHSHHSVIMHSLDDHNPLSIFQNSHLSVWRHPIAYYNVANYPYFVFHPMQSEFSSCSETFKGYAYHLLQYRLNRLIHVIKFVVCWSNHLCRFMLQNMTMLVNVDLTPSAVLPKVVFDYMLITIL